MKMLYTCGVHTVKLETLLLKCGNMSDFMHEEFIFTKRILISIGVTPAQGVEHEVILARGSQDVRNILLRDMRPNFK